MFADISHAFRTPLTVIRGEAEVTLRARDGTRSDYRATLARIVETAAQLNKLVEELLEVARSEAPPFRRDERRRRHRADPRRWRRCQGAGRGQGHSRVLRGAERPIHIRGDADRLRQLLLILLDNACRYTPADGEIAISLAARRRMRW